MVLDRIFYFYLVLGRKGLNMSLTTSLLHARSGLVGAQAGLDVVSRNIANATTEGYTKKIHNQANLIIGGTGSGLKVCLLYTSPSPRD